jgi:hypothetical protein
VSDLKAISPAPWLVRPQEFDDWGLVRAGDGKPVLSTCCESRIGDARNLPYGPEREAGPPEVAANAEFAALARNAYDVMMRRGWYAGPCNKGGWEAFYADGTPVDGLSPNIGHADPFTALVAADAWMKEQESRL